jgi:hypothetical protein
MNSGLCRVLGESTSKRTRTPRSRAVSSAVATHCYRLAAFWARPSDGDVGHLFQHLPLLVCDTRFMGQMYNLSPHSVNQVYPGTS